MEIKTVGVVGAGVMGVGVAQNLAQTGHRAILIDLSDEILERARGSIRQGLRFGQMFDKGASGAPREKAADVLARIVFSTDLDLLAEVDFVVENVIEKWQEKEPIYRRLDAVCRPEVRFAANTSVISITKIGGATSRPDKVLGMHFMNPVPQKDTVEVIRGYRTSEETLAIGRQFLAQMGKEGIVVNDAPGFVSNRVLMLTVNEAIFLVQDGVAPAEDVDRLFKTCFGHKMGPLETADLIGLDTILFSIEGLYEQFSDSKFRPCPLLRKMVDAGLLGRKSGQGFYDYGVGH